MAARSFQPRLVLVAELFPSCSETFIVNKLLSLRERGLDVQVVCRGSEPGHRSLYPDLARPELRRAVHVTWPRRPRWLMPILTPAALIRCLLRRPSATWRYLRHGWPRFRFTLFRQLRLDAELICLEPDLIHFEFGTLARRRLYLKELLGCGVVVSFRGYDINHSGLGDDAYFDDVWGHADALHLVAEDLWRTAQRRGCPAEKLHVILPSGVDARYFDPGSRESVETAGTPERPLRVLSIGRLEWKKGHEYALQAIRHLVDRGIRCEFRIVGEGSHRKAVEYARRQMGLEEHTTFLGARSRSEVREELRRADVLLHMSVTEGFCNVIMEAQSMALPVVSSDAGGLPETIVDGVTGFLVPCRDPRAAAEKLALLAADPTLREQMGRAGRERVLERFQVSDQIAALEVLYRRVLASSSLSHGKRATLRGPGKITPARKHGTTH